jgi:hypothetical protein
VRCSAAAGSPRIGTGVAPDLTLLISDEAAGKDAAITAYAYRP